MSNVGQIKAWYSRAQIDYIHSYMSLYAAFNAWYSTEVNVSSDREAINELRNKAIPEWRQYIAGEGLVQLYGYMRQLVECTQRDPIAYSSPHWKGVVSGPYDWASLLEYWYRVRCLVMHGASIRPEYVYLAYQTLNLVLGQIIRRLPD